jgi:hypothetical protein
MGWDNPVEMHIVKGLLAANVYGPLTTGLLTQLVLRYIIGVNFIGRRLFRAQSHKGEELTKTEIAQVVRGFKHSEEPSIIKNFTYRSDLTEIDYSAADRDQRVIDIAAEVIRKAIDYADASFYTKERSRMVSRLSINE